MRMGITTLLWIVFWIVGAAWTASTMDTSYQQHVLAECSFTRYPSLCLDTLSTAPNADNIVSALLDKTISETRLPSSSGTSAQSRLAHAATLDYCGELMSMSLHRLNQSLVALKQSPGKNKEDIQTWLSAALTYQQTCKDELAKLGAGVPSGLVDYMSKKMDYLSELVSNPLALVNRISGYKQQQQAQKSTTTTGKKGREEVFPGWVSPRDRKLLQSTAGSINANAVVAKDGTGQYTTISAAINAADGNRFVIHVKAGVYNEKINTKKDGITLIGDGKYSTIIASGSSVAHGTSLSGSATFTIAGDGFIAKDIGFQNTAGPNGEQAVAINIASDHSVFFRCSIAGHQDTLYAHALRQFYRDCDIYGTIDFIFGNAAAVFQNCNIMLRRPRSGGFNAVLANGRSDPGQNTGFSVHKCKIGPASEFAAAKHSVKSYLGRPWKMYSRAVVMESSIDDAIVSRGWNEWEGAGGSTYKNLYFAEYANIGPGASTSGRVQWPGYHVMGATEAAKFTVANFISGTSWLPSTGVDFISGLQ